MSGPKDYTPPPRYSIKVFNGKLNQIFQLQSKLKWLCSDLNSLKVSDTELDIHFDCKIEMNRCQYQIDKLLASVIFDYKGTFGQETYTKIEKETTLKIQELQSILAKLELAKADFNNKQIDYNAYLEYLNFYKNSNISFAEFKNQIIHYFKTNTESVIAEIFKKAEKEISIVQFTLGNSKFDFGFSNQLVAEKKKIIDHIIQKEKDMSTIRAEISDNIITKLGNTKTKSKIINKDSVKTNIIIIDKIKSQISNCEDSILCKKYNSDLKKLIESDSLKDIFYFEDLHDTILIAEKTRKLKIKINDVIAELNTFSFHNQIQLEKQNLIMYSLNLFSKVKVTINEYNDLYGKLQNLKIESLNLQEEDDIKNKERLFLKSQIIHCLENQGYEVMDDLNVIDFEKENDFLLKVQGQNNYLNLKFKDDGSIRYVFQIPEDKKELTTDQKNMKLHEMKVTCSEFQSVLKDLSLMGLNVQMRSEKPVEFDSIISITNNVKEKLKIKSKVQTQQQTQQNRKRYLN